MASEYCRRTCTKCNSRSDVRRFESRGRTANSTRGSMAQCVRFKLMSALLQWRRTRSRTLFANFNAGMVDPVLIVTKLIRNPKKRGILWMGTSTAKYRTQVWWLLSNEYSLRYDMCPWIFEHSIRTSLFSNFKAARRVRAFARKRRQTSSVAYKSAKAKCWKTSRRQSLFRFVMTVVLMVVCAGDISIISDSAMLNGGSESIWNHSIEDQHFIRVHILCKNLNAMHCYGCFSI